MISIIIPTYNREKLLVLAIQSLVAQHFPSDRFEILVVDNGSTDNTKQVIEAIIADNPCHEIRYIFEPEPGLLSGRHRGASEAKGNILIFIDDDIRADVNWLRAIEESFTDPTVQLVGGRNLPEYEVAPPEWLLNLFWGDYHGGRACGGLSLSDYGDRVREIDAGDVWGLNFSIRRKALFELGGFHPDCVPKRLQHFQGDGEVGLAMKATRLAYKAVYQPRALVFHYIPQERMTYEYFDQRCFYQGVTDSYTEIRQLSDALSILPLRMEVEMKTLERRIRSKLKVVKEKILKSAQHLSLEEKALQQRFREATLEGYLFHRNAVRTYPELLNWVLRENYWDYKLPQLAPSVTAHSEKVRIQVPRT